MKRTFIGFLFIALSLSLSFVSAYVIEQQMQSISQTITNIPYYYADNNTSNVDAVDDVGTHSNFTAQQMGPGATTDNLTEALDTHWLSGWAKRIRITIDVSDVGEPLTNFPILVYLSANSGRLNDDVSAIFDELQSDANRKKIAITTADGISECYVEIERWDDGQEQAWLWVNIPSISNTTDTDLYLYYDSSQPDNTVYVGDKETVPAQTVWNTDFAGVWHLNEDPSGTAPQMNDSTSNAHNGTSYGSMTSGNQVIGRNDGSLDLDGTNDYIQTTSNELETLENFTLSVWFKVDSTTTPQHIIWEGPSSQNGWGDGSGNPLSHEMHLTIGKFDANDTLNFFYGYEESGDVWVPAVEINMSFTDTTNWNHAVVVMTGAGTSPSAELYLNGVSQGTDTGTQTNRSAWDTSLRIGRPGSDQRYFNGTIDEVRILGSMQSAEWVSANYESERDELLDYHSEEIQSYQLDLEVQWTSVDYSETNEELCLFVADGTSSLDATGGYLRIGDGLPDWGSTQGTISFWVKMDDAVQGRFWGQSGNMETRWSGANLVLDWGGTASLTSATSFSADQWYFVAIVWNETADDLLLYVGDAVTLPTLDANSLNGTWTNVTPTPTENRFLNGLGGDQPVDGHGDDLRYWNISRTLQALQGDYNTSLTGVESGLRSYFPFDGDLADHGPNTDDGVAVGSSLFSTDVSFWNLSSEALQVDVWTDSAWQNVISSLTYGWNNVTVTSYLMSSPFTIRYQASVETNDLVQDRWYVDVAVLHVWT
ncbi:MAG: DUF2341 domain-containing protein [Candidatus Bathyarchaeota archaeon]|nr:DUF2341 domain-containing protein [Candidatus Bathyarchaeota archaeon]